MDEPHEGKTFAPGWPCWKIKGKKALEQEGVKSKQSKIHIINVLLNSVGRSVRESICLYRTDWATKKDFFGQTDRPRPKTSGKYYPIQNSHTVKQAFIIEQPGFYYLPPPGGYVSTCVCLSVCLFVCLSICLSICLFVSVCLSVARTSQKVFHRFSGNVVEGLAIKLTGHFRKQCVKMFRLRVNSRLSLLPLYYANI